MIYEDKVTLLKTYTTDAKVIDNIILYCENKFCSTVLLPEFDSCNIDDLSIKTWSVYERIAKDVGIYNVLKSRIVQFMLPVNKGISTTDLYKKATRQGIYPSSNLTGLQLIEPELITLKIHSSLVGRIPVLIIPNREDFKSVTRALLHKNEPVEISDSMGAVMISGLNNWDRIHQYKREWLQNNPNGDWNFEFKTNIIPKKSYYQDKLILLSKSFYSNVSNVRMGLRKSQWFDYSLQIRLEHECAHFFTKQHFGCMNNNMHDELIADYMGISKVLGQFNAQWFLKFIGLDKYPNYRSGGRFENYINKDWYDSDEFRLLSTILYKASHVVERFDNIIGSHKTASDKVARLLSLCSVDLITMSSDIGLRKLLQCYQANLC